MTIVSKPLNDKYCFTYCGDDKCNCISGEIKMEPGTAAEHSRYTVGYDLGYKEGFYEGFRKAIEMLDYKPPMPPVTLNSKDCFNMGRCLICNVVMPVGVSMGLVCSVPGCPRNATSVTMG